MSFVTMILPALQNQQSSGFRIISNAHGKSRPIQRTDQNPAAMKLKGIDVAEDCYLALFGPKIIFEKTTRRKRLA